jgi:cytochrome P450
MAQDTTLFHQIYDPANRANPYPIFAQLRETPVCWQEDGPDETGAYVVSTYREIVTLLHDPRLSSDLRLSTQLDGRIPPMSEPRQFIATDPPEHDRVRRLAMRHFGPPERPEFLEQLRPEVLRIVTTLIDELGDGGQIDFVERFAYPLPVTVICRILGVPREDEPQFHEWSKASVEGIGEGSEEGRQRRAWALSQLQEYLAELVKRHRKQPGDDMLSRMVTEDDPEVRLDDANILTTAELLLVAGHETTVNLLANGMLTLLRNPSIVKRLRREPDLIPPRGGGNAPLRATGSVST